MHPLLTTQDYRLEFDVVSGHYSVTRVPEGSFVGVIWIAGGGTLSIDGVEIDTTAIAGTPVRRFLADPAHAGCGG
ncbi:hypothetical protein [Castellaniella sp.]|uniref:hypothetical protein n=1 Tax=Castellaniella sp. TaxID=1955812 RepID=UPI002AFF5324|nr:hypothetical protein [Castellaniella sp.]